MAPSYSRPVDESVVCCRPVGTPDNNQRSSSAAAPSVGAVIVKGVSEVRDNTKRIIGWDLLDNPDEPYVLQVLAKTPGLTVTNGGVSMLGLGERATRILVDGRRPPIGFRLSNVRGSDVERVDYTFGSDTVYAGEGVAGTINIVMRRNSVKAISRTSKTGRVSTLTWSPAIAPHGTGMSCAGPAWIGARYLRVMRLRQSP